MVIHFPMGNVLPGSALVVIVEEQKGIIARVVPLWNLRSICASDTPTAFYRKWGNDDDC